MEKILASILIFAVTTAFATGEDRDSKTLTFRQNAESLNIEHIISLWNRSVSDESASSESVTKSTTIVTPTLEPKTVPKKSKPSEKLPETFVERFNYCLMKYKIGVKGVPDQKVVLKCLKAELLTNLQLFLTNSGENIKLFNGYLEFQKLENSKKDSENANENEVQYFPPVKKYSSRVSSKKTAESPVPKNSKDDAFVPVLLKKPKPTQNSTNDYYENYQKMLRELVARKTGAELSRKKREDPMLNPQTLEKSAKLLETGRKLFSEISNTLDRNDEHVESFTQTILDPELFAAVNNFTKNYAVRFNFYPGIAARMTRNENSGVTFDLELDEVNDIEAEEEEEDDNGGRGGKKKKPIKKKVPKKLIKKLFPYLLIPFMIQAALLPIVLKFLLFVAIKALIAGKLALILVAFNAIRNASLKSDEDEYVERMSFEHYGYGNGEEYGAWVNRRQFDLPEGAEAREEEEHEEYMAYNPPR